MKAHKILIVAKRASRGSAGVLDSLVVGLATGVGVCDVVSCYCVGSRSVDTDRLVCW